MIEFEIPCNGQANHPGCNRPSAVAGIGSSIPMKPTRMKWVWKIDGYLDFKEHKSELYHFSYLCNLDSKGYESHDCIFKSEGQPEAPF